MITRISLSVDE